MQYRRRWLRLWKFNQRSGPFIVLLTAESQIRNGKKTAKRVRSETRRVEMHFAITFGSQNKESRKRAKRVSRAITIQRFALFNALNGALKQLKRKKVPRILKCFALHAYPSGNALLTHFMHEQS
jgi:hypothetical protein